MTIAPRMPTCRGLSTASMDPADEPRDVGSRMNCQHTLTSHDIIFLEKKMKLRFIEDPVEKDKPSADCSICNNGCCVSNKNSSYQKKPVGDNASSLDSDDALLIEEITNQLKL